LPWSRGPYGPIFKSLSGYAAYSASNHNSISEQKETRLLSNRKKFFGCESIESNDGFD
jgi:hypothetical protein